MSEKKLTTLEARKQLLIAESEINRMLAAQEYEIFASQLREKTAPIRQAGALVSSGAAILKAFCAGAGKGNEADSGRHWYSSGIFRFLLDMLAGVVNKPEPEIKKEEELV
jgi:hypothetical protein